MLNQLRNQFRDMGLLRNGLHLVAVVFALLLPLALVPTDSEDWELFFRNILPASAPLIVILIGLDMMMSKIWKSDSSEQDVIQRFNTIIRWHQVIGGLLLLVWLAIFLPVLIR